MEGHVRAKGRSWEIYGNGMEKQLTSQWENALKCPFKCKWDANGRLLEGCWIGWEEEGLQENGWRGRERREGLRKAEKAKKAKDGKGSWPSPSCCCGTLCVIDVFAGYLLRIVGACFCIRRGEKLPTWKSVVFFFITILVLSYSGFKICLSIVLSYLSIK